MSTPHHSGDHHGDHPAPEADHTHHPDHASHEHHADADTHGQAMHHGHPHSVLDEDHQVHGHGEHAGHSTAMFRERFWWSLILSIPVVIFSPMVAHLLGYPLPEFPGSTWIPPVLDTIIFFYGGTPFLKGGWKEVKSRQPGMMLLIAMAITVAFVASWVTTLGLGGFDLDFWWELALLVTIMLLGHWLEMRALGGASSALDALAALLPDEAEKVIDGTTRTVDISELVVGDVVLVRAGARVPADGTIIDGAAEFDEGMITGESRPVFRDTGDKVVAGTVATDNTVRVRVEATGGDTALAGIQRMVADAQESSSRAQALADRAAALLFWFALISALITAVVWTTIGSPDDAVVRTVTVLVIACPHALGLAIPLVIAISTERAAKSGVLIKDRMALERMRTIDVVLFDKTGTLTEGAHAVTGVAATVGDRTAPSATPQGREIAGTSQLMTKPTAKAERNTRGIASIATACISRRKSMVGIRTAAENSRGGSTISRMMFGSISMAPTCGRNPIARPTTSRIKGDATPTLGATNWHATMMSSPATAIRRGSAGQLYCEQPHLRRYHLTTVATRAAHVQPGDAELLARAEPILAPHAMEMVDTWRGILAQKTYLAAHSAHPDGQPNPEYAQASKPRFAQWIIDMCTRERDQAWLDYQYLIGARHMSAAKNAADGADSTPFVPLRYVLAFIAPTVEVGHRLLAEGFEGEELSAVRDAWTRAVTVAVTVWAYAYRDHPEQF